MPLATPTSTWCASNLPENSFTMWGRGISPSTTWPPRYAGTDLIKKWFKLNFDGASQWNPRKASGGGIIHDHYGKWIKGYMRNIGNASNIVAEFWALRDGLMLPTQLGITQLLVELDTQVIVNLVLSKKPINRSYSSLLNDCRYLLG